VTHPLGAVLGVVFFTILELFAQHLIASVLHLPGQIETMLFGTVLIITLLRWPNGLLTWVRLSNSYAVGRGDRPKVAKAVRRRKASTTVAVSNLTKKFGGLTALSSVTLTVPPATITGLIGPNGAGKSTLFNVMTGVYPATEGEVSIGGTALPKAAKDVVRSGVARTFQHVQLVQELDVLQNVLIGAFANGKAGLLSAAIGTDRVEEAQLVEAAMAVIERVGLAAVSSAVVSSLPLGSQRLVEVARALMADPRVVLLDEPAAGLRATEKRQLAELLRSLRDEDGITVLLVEHDMELVMGCADYLFVLNYGALLAQGSPREVQQNPAVVAAYLGGEA
jgi:branched-chain amino acid transport system permease protein